MMKRRKSLPLLDTPELDWHHEGVPHRVRLASAAPRQPAASEPVVFERQIDGLWEPFDPDPMSEVFESAAMWLTDDTWNDFVRELPWAMRDFLRGFQFERLEALAVAVQCPAFLDQLDLTPALTLFVAGHVALRGTDGPRWAEIRAVHERGGIYAVLEWLGLPASPQTLAVLTEIADPEIPRHHLAAVRAELWESSGCNPLAA